MAVPNMEPSAIVLVPRTSPARWSSARSTEKEQPPDGALSRLATTITMVMAKMDGKQPTEAMVTLVQPERPGLMRLPTLMLTLAHTLMRQVTPMRVPRVALTRLTARTTMPMERPDGLPRLTPGTVLAVLATMDTPRRLVDTLTKTWVPPPPVLKMLLPWIRVTLMHVVLEGSIPRMIQVLKVASAGALLQLVALQPVVPLKVMPEKLPVVAALQQPAATATLNQTPSDTVLADGAPLIEVQLMLLRAKTATRTVTNTEVVPRTNTVLLTVLPMPVLVDTVVHLLSVAELVLPVLLVIL